MTGRLKRGRVGESRSGFGIGSGFGTGSDSGSGFGIGSGFGTGSAALIKKYKESRLITDGQDGLSRGIHGVYTDRINT